MAVEGISRGALAAALVIAALLSHARRRGTST
jgi:hypothetical protein